MQFKTFKIFVSKIAHEGNRLQKVDITGNPTTKRRFTDMQILAVLLAVVAVIVLHEGFPDDFVRDIVVFLGVFVGLFAGIVISLHDKRKDLLAQYEEKSQIEKTEIKKIRNYLVQFTGLTAYAILLALILIILLTVSLLHKGFFELNIWEYELKGFHDIDIRAILCFTHVSLLIIHRFLISYLLVNFFAITIYAITSYFSYVLSDYNKIKM